VCGHETLAEGTEKKNPELANDKKRTRDGFYRMRQRNLTIFKMHYGSLSGNVSTACYFTARRASMASMFTWSLRLWWSPLRVPQSESVHQSTTDHRWPDDRNSKADFSEITKHGEASTRKLRERLEEYAMMGSSLVTCCSNRNKQKGKLSLYETVKVHRVVRRRGSHIF
jgi:hypothetical protein